MASIYPFPLARPLRWAWPRAVTTGTAPLAPILALPLAASFPVPAGAALPMAAALEAALGTACCWGLSPALDLHQHLLDAGGGDVTALLVGAAEGRHVLLTASRAHREPRSAITIFVAEQRPEAVARQLLFLLLATTEPAGSTGLRARAAALLELLGSVRLRPSTARLLEGAAGRLRRWVMEGGAEVDGPPMEVELMKSRERDALDAVLRGWEGGHRNPPRDPHRDWDQRLRRLHGVRYDARAALADWDLRMELHQRGATTVSPPEFALWRSSGIAFIPRAGGGEVGIPNPTLQSGRCPRADGQPGAERGFWGDVVTGPFLIFGLTRIGTDEKTATEISVAKVTELLWELHSRGGCEEPPRDEGDEDGDADPPEEPLWDGGSPLRPALPPSVRIRFLPLGSAQRPPVRAGLEQRCGVIVLGWSFVPVLRPPQIEAFRARAAALALGGGFEPWGGPEVPLGYARFRRSPPP
ncbi:dynein assembly factor 3, axonemal [Phasianus colchicus]|uniref:Dynein axonemal assembly factor 3 n=1 Tax=Phasianus colchicus TaxID=9054 RepID=A0A669QCY3_PHACC|nr:dynein assembly factor 3, axonemal [Phasianus colchicus]